MKKILHFYFLAFSFLILLSGCSQDVYDDYYKRPESLEPPIYQQLEARGNFKNLMVLIEKAGYKDILSKAGYWTMMAPNDEAFSKFFQEQGISDVNKMDSITASKIVRYALIYNAFRTEQLSDYQSAAGWVADNAFRRRTAYYDGFQTKTINGKPMIVVGSNRNNNGGAGYYISGDNNNKYISYFEKEYFAAKGLNSNDYNFFFPNSIYTDFNVLGGAIKEANIIAENGIIQEVNQISLPLVNLDQHLENSSQYSLFRSLLQNNLVTYVFNQSATTTYRNYTGKTDDVYVKVYDRALPYSLNNENYLKQADNDGQSDAYTLFAPDNTSLQKFIDEVLLKNFTSLDKLPKYVFEDFFKAHMVTGAVWPSKLSSFNNALDEELRFNLNTDVKEAKVVSNGFFYGTNKIQASNLFYSVYTSAYLDPKFTLATRLFNDGSSYREIISNINQKYTLFLPSDTVLLALGYDYNTARSEWMYVSPVTGVSSTAVDSRLRLLRVLYNSIVPTPEGELNDLSGSGIIRSGDMDIPGEYIKWSNNKVYAAGNEALGNMANILGYEDQQNGRTYYIDKLLEFSEESPGVDLKNLAAPSGSEYFNFYSYLKNSTIFNATGDKILGVDLGTSYTFVVPNNAAIVQAVKDGKLPGNITTGAPNFAPVNLGEQDIVADFIRYHILATKTVSDDGLLGGQIETLRKDSRDEKTYVGVMSDKGVLTFIDKANRSANFIPNNSNNLADRSLIHLVDNYLLYTE
ncbi:fasciclin domain-containing protein [Flavobacterium piscis]|uniref:Surface protein with fasciclin (FAS1) repeats n=1 Tax=Flavobacterium piscis TaxID=1114874 RepID=A0ABU1Y745_9FLAO|nr:fasciclin domain-containing protein [Flavobacterium piscis]MDR7209455.1 putative surface protein with fasciclin (FAS1) repeats [Flavobacterium piscis]